MAKIFITGSADGLGQLTAKALTRSGHEVVLHARSEARGRQALAGAPGAAGVLIADLSSIAETKKLAAKANALGTFDAVIHNAGIYRVPGSSVGAEGLSLIFTVNSLAPYVLTCMMNRPGRLIYLSSGMHRQGNADVDHLPDGSGNKGGHISYSDTKLHDLLLCNAVARRWWNVCSNTVNPGWVPTKMGGSGAPDSLEKGYETQVWLAVSNEAAAKVSGVYFHHKKQETAHRSASDTTVQDTLMERFAAITGVELPPH